MKLELFNNGVDSLKFGMDFYYKYLELEDKYNSDDNPGYLKMAVISIHNCLELFSKKLLCEVNELLIYKDLSDKVLLDLIKFKNDLNKDIPLDYFMISDQINILTIDYNECVKRIGIIFDMNKSQLITLKSIGKIRNKITHFGLDKTIDFHDILIEINKSLNLILDFYYPKFETKDKVHPLEHIYEAILDLLEIAEIVEYESWEVYFADNFEDINYLFNSLFENEEFLNCLSAKGYKYEVELGKYSHSSTLKFVLIDSNGEIYKEIFSTNIPALNATLFTEGTNAGPIYFVIDHMKKLLDEEKDCYIYKNPKELIDFEDEENKFWEEDVQNNKKLCYSVKFTEEQLIRIIHSMI